MRVREFLRFFGEKRVLHLVVPGLPVSVRRLVLFFHRGLRLKKEILSDEQEG